MKTILFIKLLLMTAISMAFAFSIGGTHAAVPIFGVLMAMKFIPLPSSSLLLNPFADTTLFDVRQFISSDENMKFELRNNQFPLTKVFLAGQTFLANLSSFKTSLKRPTKAVFFTKKDFTVHSGVACNFESPETIGTSEATITWNTKSVYAYNPSKPFQDNMVNQKQALAMNMLMAERSLFNHIETALATYMAANKSGVNAGQATLGTWDGANDVMTIALANKSRFYANVIAQMKNNKYYAPFFDICDAGWEAELIAQNENAKMYAGMTGTGSYTYQGIEIVPSNSITPAAGQLSQHFIIPTGGVAMAFWNDPINNDQREKVTGTRGYWDSMLMPGIRFDLKTKDSCEDTTAIGGDTDDDTQSIRLSTNFAISKQPLTTADETPIFKYIVPTT